MILFCGIPSEPPLALAIQAAQECGIGHVVFNQRQVQFADFCLDIRDGAVGGFLRNDDKEWPLDRFSGAYTRLIESNAIPENRPRGRTPADEYLVARSAYFHELLGEWLEWTRCRVANRASAAASNISKPYQTRLIAQAGFLTPATVVTNDPAEVGDFRRQHGKVIYKSVSAVRSIVQELTDERIKGLGQIRHLPTQFQAFIPGVNVRVHVVGKTVFATEVTTGAVDYRYAGREGLEVEMSAAELPDSVRARCLILSTQLGLPFCGIDLKRTPAGEYFCFEVNPSPAYSYYQDQTGQPIATALVRFLIGWD